MLDYPVLLFFLLFFDTRGVLFLFLLFPVAIISYLYTWLAHFLP